MIQLDDHDDLWCWERFQPRTSVQDRSAWVILSYIDSSLEQGKEEVSDEPFCEYTGVDGRVVNS